ncbi:MAG: amidohydrolase family protein, partial [Pseudoflavonifractor sp.]
MNPENYDLLLRNATYLNPQMGITSGKTIAIRDGSIAAILEGDAPATAEQTMDGRGLLWMPGLVDGHTHTSQQLLRGRLLDEKPVIWKRVNVPFESRLTQESARLSAQLAALEMIKNGTTGFLDAGGKYVETYAEVYTQSGLRGGLT